MARQVDVLTKQMQQLQDQVQEQMAKFQKGPQKLAAEDSSPLPPDEFKDKQETSDAIVTPSSSDAIIAAPEASQGSFSHDDRESLRSEELRMRRASVGSESIRSSEPATTPQRSVGSQSKRNAEMESSASAVSTEKTKTHRLSPSALQDMRRVSRRLSSTTTWLRAVHSGHGQDLWRIELESKGMVVVHSPSPAEGAYVLIPPCTTPEEVARALLQINLGVRRRTHFNEMNRANKSRVVFKCEPFTVHPTGDERPALVRTTRFSQAPQAPQAPSQFQQTAQFVPQASPIGDSQTNTPSMADQAWHGWNSDGLSAHSQTLSAHSQTDVPSMTDQAWHNGNSDGLLPVQESHTDATSTAGQEWQNGNSDGNSCADGSLSLDILAQMAPVLDQKSRTDYADMAADMDVDLHY
jgi:hypothetical protein